MIAYGPITRWKLFKRGTLPLSCPKALSSLSLSQIDSFAASVVAAAEATNISCFQVLKFNRIDGVFEYSYFPNSIPGLINDVYNEKYFTKIILFLKYLYNIDTRNQFVKTYVRDGNEEDFAGFWNSITSKHVYLAFKKIDKTQNLISNFFAKIKLGQDYKSNVDFWENCKD